MNSACVNSPASNCRLWLGLALALLLGANAQAQSLPQVASSSSELMGLQNIPGFVAVGVDVQDHSGRFVTDLHAEDFKVYEDGKEQPLRFFSDHPRPLSLAVLVGLNLSPKIIDRVKDSLPTLIEGLLPGDKVSLYSYDKSVRQLTPASAPGNQIQDSISALASTVDPSSKVVLNDAIVRASNDLTRDSDVRQRVIVVVGDELESGSENSANQVRNLLLSRDICLFAVAVDVKLGRFSTDSGGLGASVTDTGGKAYAAFDLTGTEQAYTDIIARLHQQYIVGFVGVRITQPTSSDIDIHVHRPNLIVTLRNIAFTPALGR